MAGLVAHEDFRKRVLTFPAEDILQANAEDAADAKGAFERRGITPLLDCDDGLPRNADLFGECRLAQLAVLFAQLFDAVGNREDVWP